MTTAYRAAIYCRISRDPEGLKAGVERQEEDCRAHATRMGWDVHCVYIDNDISASTLSRKRRPQYDAMLEAARAGEFDVIVAYSNSRLTRRLAELEGLIQLHEQHGTVIATVVSGQDDLSTADGRMVARIKASVDSAESERAAERIRRAHLARARRGATNHGGRPFGWAEDKLALDPVEAQHIRQAAQDVLDGVPLREVARLWNEAGVRTSRGMEWSHTTVRRLLDRPRLAGWRTHHDKIALDAAGRPVRGEWEPILDQDQFDRLQLVLAKNTRGGSQRPGKRQYLLAGLARCGTCGGRLYGAGTKRGTHTYTCCLEGSGHTVTIVGPQTDEFVEAVVRERLSTEDLPTPEPPAEDPAEERLEQIPELIAQLMEAFTAGRLGGHLVFPQIEALEAERAELSAARARYIRTTAVPTPVDPAHLGELSVERRRAVIEQLVEAVVVSPASRRGEPWGPHRFKVVWRTA